MTAPNMPQLNHDRLRQRRERRSGGGWKPKEGPNKVRILPPGSKYLTAWDQMADIAVSAKVHFFRVEGKPATVSRCLEELRQKCPACDAWRAHRKSADPGLAERAKQIAPADQYFFNILDVNDLKTGIQAWAANYTCWDKILEVAANPAWGNVVDPANGVNFDVSMTAGKNSRTGYNQYSVMPEPQRTTVMAILDAIPEWQKSLDTLEEHIPAAKTVEEITTCLEEMGFVLVRRAVAAATQVGFSPPAVAAAAPAPSAAPLAPSAPLAAPLPVVAMPGIAPVAPAPVAPLSVAPVAPAAAPAPVGVPQQVAAPSAVAAVGVGVHHYNPGPAYQPVIAESERPSNAPRCYGDYDPKVHQCRACPVLVDCQMKILDRRP